MRLASAADVLWGSSSVQRPALTERNIQKTNAYLKDSRPEQKSLVTLHTLPSLYICVWLVNTLTSTVPIGSPIICMWSPSDICEQWERNLSFGSADVSGAGTRDEPLRTSAWEATVRPHFYSAGSTFLNKHEARNEGRRKIKHKAPPLASRFALVSRCAQNAARSLRLTH